MRKRIMLKVALLVVVLSGFSINASAAFITLSGQIIESGLYNFMDDVVVTAYPTISCGSWTGTSGGTNAFGIYSLSVPDNCNFYIYPTRKDYQFDPVYYYVTPSTVNNDFDFTGIYDPAQ